MKIAKKKVKMQTPSVNPIDNLERPLEKVCKKGDYGGGSPEELLVWKDKLLKALDGQSISKGPLRYMFTERLLTGDTKATFNQAALDTCICTIDNFNKGLLEMTKHTFPAYAFCKQKRYLRRHLIKPRSMKPRSFISRLQELNPPKKDFA